MTTLIYTKTSKSVSQKLTLNIDNKTIAITLTAFLHP